MHQERVGGMDRIVLNTSTLGAGLHHYRLLAPDGRSAARAFVVQHWARLEQHGEHIGPPIGQFRDAR